MPDASSALARIPAGLRYMVLAAFFFSLMSLMVKVAGQRLPSMQIVLVRSVITLVISYALLRRARVAVWGQRRGLLVFRGLAGFTALSCFYYAITQLPLADVTVLHYTSPVVVAVLAAVFLGEAMRRSEWMGLVLSLAGVVLVAQPSFLFGATPDGLNLVAVSIALGGAVASAIAYVTVRKLRETEHALRVVFYFPLVSTPASVPPVLLEALWPTPLEWLVLLGVGVCTQFGQVYLTKGLHAEQAGRAMSVSYLQILFAALWGLFFFSEVPDGLSVAGAVLVIGGTLLTTRAASTPEPS